MKVILKVLKLKNNQKTNQKQLLSSNTKTKQHHQSMVFGQISKPGLRIYATHKELPKVPNGLGVAIMTTSKGIMSDKQEERKM